MTNYQMIRFESDVFYNQKFNELKKNRELSKTVNSLVRTFLNTETELPQDKNIIDQELEKLSARRESLIKQKEDLEKEERELAEKRKKIFFIGDSNEIPKELL